MDTVFMARQAIFDAEKNVYGYELLFREGMTNSFPEICPNEATSKLIEGGFLGSTLVSQVSQHRSFINFTFDNMIKNLASFLDPQLVVIEILEHTRPGAKLLAACKELKAQGYTIALDDYVDHQGWYEFLPFIDIVKVDLQATPLQEWFKIKAKMQPFRHLQFLAEKVETQREFELCKQAGFTLFQGYFFAKPEVLQGKTIPTETMSLLSLMQELLKATVSTDEVTQIIEKDIPMTMRLLHYANSAKFKRKAEIDTVKRAVVLLGNTELYKFASLLFLTQVASHKPEEILRLSLIRARFCESLSESCAPEHRDHAFMVGLLSMIDALLDMPMREAVNSMPLSALLKNALVDRDGMLGSLLRAVQSYEQGNWVVFEALATGLRIDLCSAATYYLDAVMWSEDLS